MAVAGEEVVVVDRVAEPVRRSAWVVPFLVGCLVSMYLPICGFVSASPGRHQKQRVQRHLLVAPCRSVSVSVAAVAGVAAVAVSVAAVGSEVELEPPVSQLLAALNS